MAKNLGEALNLLNRMGAMDAQGMNIDDTSSVVAYINHKYREEVILPYVAIQNNISFMLTKGERMVVTSDNITCKVVVCKEVHICEIEEDVKRLYGIDCWQFIKRWYTTKKSMDSLHFVYLKIEKENV